MPSKQGSQGLETRGARDAHEGQKNWPGPLGGPGRQGRLGWALLDRLGRSGRFLWAAWAGLAGLALLAAVWQLGHEAFGDFILPSPLSTLQAGWGLLQDPAAWDLLWLTTQRALMGCVLSIGIGSMVGIAAGYSPATLRLTRPVLTIMLGVPPIAWIVLAMIWFGASDATVAVTILISASPLVFMGAAEGIAQRDRGLEAMAQVFGAGRVQRFLRVSLRQMTGQWLPSVVLALGTSFKVAIMAELLANAGGVGGALARARSLLDISQALAWVLLAVVVLIIVEYGLVRPFQGELDRWRQALQPWGVKR